MTNRFTLQPLATESRDSFGKYEYEICDGDNVIARYWHDFRGDEHGLAFPDGRKHDRPIGQMTDFITGGGPHPIELSAAAQKWLAERLAE